MCPYLSLSHALTDGKTESRISNIFGLFTLFIEVYKKAILATLNGVGFTSWSVPKKSVS